MRSLRFAPPLAALALVAAGCGTSLGGRYDSATTAPPVVRATGVTTSTLRVVTAQPLPPLDPAFATTRQSRAIANLLCTPLVRYADAEGLPGHGHRPGPRTRPADRRARQPHLPGAIARRPALRRRQPLTTAGRAGDVRAPARPGDRLAGRRAVRRDRRRQDFPPASTPHLRGVRARGGQITFSLKRSDPAFLARLAMPIACPVPSQHAPPRGARPARAPLDRPLPRRRELVVGDRPRARQPRRVAGAERRGAGRGRRDLDRAARRRRRARTADPPGTLPTSRSTICPVTSTPALAVPSSAARDPACSIRRAGRSRTRRVRRALSLALDRRSPALADGGDVVAGALAAARSAGAERGPRRPRAARALLRKAGAEGTLQLELWAAPGTQDGVARAIAVQLDAVGVKVTVRVATAGERPAMRAGLARVADAGLRRSRRDLRAARGRAAAEVAGRARAPRPARGAAGGRCAPRGVPSPRRSPRRRGPRCDSAAARKLFHADLVHAGGERHPPGLRHRPRAALHTTMTAPRPPHPRSAALRDGQAVGFHGRRRRGQRGRARSARRASRACDDCTEWRALAEAVVLHVRTTPPSPVPAGLLPAQPHQARATPRLRAARRRRGRRGVRRGRARVAAAGWNSSPRGAVPVGRRPALGDRRRLEYERQRGRPAVPDLKARRRARRPDFVTPIGLSGRVARCGMADWHGSARPVDASGTVRAPRES